MEEVLKNENPTNKEKKGKKIGKFFTVLLFVLIVFLASALITSLVMKAKGYFLVTVDGPSMEDTIKDNDKLVALKGAKINSGDIIIISGEKSYELIKRAIAFSGDTVEIKDGKVYVNGEELDEPYAKGVTKEIDGNVSWTIEEGEIFYLGDNRENSIDSRSSLGVCTTGQVEGVVCDWSLSLRPFNNFIFGLFS